MSDINLQNKPMKILVTGMNGQLGYDVMKVLKHRGYEAIGSDIQPESTNMPDIDYIPLDITDSKEVSRVIAETHPDAVIHCAAWTAVDAAEEDANRDAVDRINHLGTQYLAEAVKKIDAKLLYISTDYVFNGTGTRPWQPDDKCFGPLNAYGASKLAGEQAVAGTLEKYFIVRTAWVFGLNGTNFIKTMIRLRKTHDAVRVVDDQIGTPTYTADLAGLLADMIETEKFGYYHATNEGGFISWYDFCCEIFRQYGLTTKVIPVATEDYGISKAQRPLNSRLGKSKLIAMGFKQLPAWQDAIARYLKEAEL